jgi:hypothetical protein
MSFLKGLLAFILSFLLIISLNIFGIAYMLNSTVINRAFVEKQVNNLDISAVARDFTEKQITNQLPAELVFLKDSFYDVIDTQEPELKKQANQAIDSGYDFLLGKTNQLKITISLSALKTNLKESLWQELDIQLAAWLRDNIQSELKPYVEQNLEEYRKVLPSELSGMTDTQLKAFLDTYYKQVQNQIVNTGKAPEMTGLLGTLLRPLYNEYYDQFIAEIPDAYVADESNIPADVMQQLQKAKQYIGYFRSGYCGLIIFMLLLAAGIFLVYRNIWEPSRTLGIDLTLFGVLDLAGALVARNIDPMDYINDIPPSLGTWIAGLYNDVIRISLVLSIVVLVIGIALIVISFVFKKKEVVEEQDRE